MRHMGETVKEMLVRQGIEAGRAGNTGRHGIDAGERDQTAAHPAIGRRPGGQTGPMGISGKGREADPAPVVDKRKHPHRPMRGAQIVGTTLRLIINPNMSGMPMTKRAKQTPFLICIEGGRA